MTKYRMLLSCVFVSLCPALALAQVSLGLIGGLNRTDLAGSRPENTWYLTENRFGLGVYFAVKLTDDVEFTTQPMYLPKGPDFRIGNPSKDDTVTYATIELDYVTVPVMFNILLGSGRFYLSSGIDFGFLQSAKFIVEGDETDLEDAVKSMDVSGELGIGYRIRWGRLFIFFEGRFSQGLINISDVADESNTRISPNIKTVGFKLFTGLAISL